MLFGFSLKSDSAEKPKKGKRQALSGPIRYVDLLLSIVISSCILLWLGRWKCFAQTHQFVLRWLCKSVFVFSC